jgi:rhodanese-related sulfurtransferase/DNA-binding transcriptional ArsR family regulator
VGTRQAKDALFDAFAAVAKALGNGRRAELVDVLTQGERSVEELAGEIGQSVANTSQHLRTLARAGLVSARRDGPRVIYALASEQVARLWSAVRDVAGDHVAGLDRLAEAYLGDRSQLEAISREELARRLEEGAVLVLDVRPAAEYRAGHLPGARSLPLSELRRQLQSLPRDVDVVAYCRGPYCAYAGEAVRELRRHGFAARRLEDGFPEWRHADLPIEVGRVET